MATPDSTMPVGGTPSVAMQSDATQSITLNCATPVTIGTSAGSYTEFWFIVPPTDFTRGFTITVTCADGGTVEKATDKSVSLARNHIYRMAPIEIVPQKPAAVPEYVDLGLSVKWATFNVGATKPEEYGEYFAWGETEPKSDYSWATYKWSNGSYSTLTKYNYQTRYGVNDGLYELEKEDDAAAVLLGGLWRIPTKEERDELKNNTDWQLTNDYKGTGVRGVIITSKVPGFTSESIFLPAAGYRSDTRLIDVGDYGGYWCATVSTVKSFGACHLYFYPDNHSWFSYYSDRCNGLSIRPVYDDRTYPESVILNKSSLSLYVGDSEQLTATVLPDNATDKFVTWSSDNTEVATVDEAGNVKALAAGTAKITVTTALGGKTATCEVTVTEPPIINGHEYVDLGLPSGLKWATCNVGAMEPEEFGDYYAWGETKAKTDYSWSNYKWCNGAYNKLTKYCTNSSFWDSPDPMDNKTVLDSDDDAASVKWGGSWRMPTEAEWTELKKNCTWTKTNDYNETGIKGFVITADNGNSIFLPAAGYWTSALHCVGSGYYWTSSIYSYSNERPYRAYYHASMTSDGSTGINEDIRCLGFSVRPVSE